TVKALGRQKAVLLVAEMGTGKTLLSMAAVHTKAAGKPYRALVMCPAQLTGKWERELRETIPGVAVVQIDSWRDLLTIDRTEKPTGPTWYVIGRDRAKLGSCWQPAACKRKHMPDKFLRCPSCGRPLVDEKGIALKKDDLARRRRFCERVID